MHRSIVFSDEKMLTIEPVVIPQHDRVLAADKKQVIFREKVIGITGHPSSVMVWGEITSIGGRHWCSSTQE